MREDFFQEYRFDNDIEIMRLEQMMKQNQVKNTMRNTEENPYSFNKNEE